MAKRFLVEFKKWNNYNNVKFIMDPKDWEFRKNLNKDNLTKIAEVDVKKKQFEHEGKTWLVFSDWSTREATAEELA